MAFTEPARSLVLALKRRGARQTVGGVAGLMTAVVLDGSFDAVTYVPAGRDAVRKGFDHARMLGRAVAARLRVPFVSLLSRRAGGPRQADVPFAERARNVEGRFAAAEASGHVLLVDDVLTTGATASVCADALKAAGASRVEVLTFARTVRRTF